MSNIGQVFQAMVETKATGGLTEATAAKVVATEGKKKEIIAALKKERMFDDVVKHLQALRPQLEANKDKIKKALTDKFCDQGLKINAKYKFKLDQQLSGEETANYFTLALQEDSDFTQMSQELTAWMETAPQELKTVMEQD